MTTLQTSEFNARSSNGGADQVDRLCATAELDFVRFEVVKDIVDECIDLSLNYRQSGHPGGSRSKVHLLLALLLSGACAGTFAVPGCGSATGSCSRPDTRLLSCTRRSQYSTRVSARATIAPAIRAVPFRKMVDGR